MIQEILPKHFCNQYKQLQPRPDDYVLCFDKTSVLANQADGIIVCPTYSMFFGDYNYIYLFAIDDIRYFLATDSGDGAEVKAVIDGFKYTDVGTFRNLKPGYMAFAVLTAYHLYIWYRDNRLCGRCGEKTVADDGERMLRCPSCGNMIFPRINPAVIVGVTDGDRLLLTKYAGRSYANYALVAGFAEIGETLEQTVAREVMEEVGLKVKNIRYYKSQPWALSGSLLAGYYCDLDGDDTISLQEEELSVGKWVDAKDIDLADDGISLTREMIVNFKKSRL